MELLDHRQLWETLRAVLGRVEAACDRATFLDDCLDALVDAVDADRGLVVLFDGAEGTRTVNARSGGRALSAREVEEVSRTVIERVRETGETVVWDSLAGDDTSASMHSLGIVTALAAPLVVPGWDSASAGGPRGVVYVDFRGARAHDLELQRQLLEAASGLIATMGEQQERLETTRRDLRRARDRGAVLESAPSLEALLQAPSLAALREEVAAAIHGTSNVLVLGESGTGKTLLARAMAGASGRRPVVRATLGSSDDLNTITSELFGHVRGAYSGATSKRVGLVEYADQGTLILDEVLNLPHHAQQLLLDFTQFGTYRPLGYDRPEARQADVRILAATNGDIGLAIREGRFREDLYYRLAGTVVELKPLRDRREDVVPLAESFLRDAVGPGRAMGLSLEARRLLADPRHGWPGNVRQLEGVVRRARERAAVLDPEARELEASHLERALSGGPELRFERPTSGPGGGEAPVIDPGDLPGSFDRIQAQRDALDAAEKAVIEEALQRCRGVLAHVARDLGMPRSSLISRIATLGIERPGRS